MPGLYLLAVSTTRSRHCEEDLCAGRVEGGSQNRDITQVYSNYALIETETSHILSKSRIMAALNILLAEDNPDDVFIFQEAFRKAGVTHRLQVVEDGVETLAYLKGEPPYADRGPHPFPDVLLLDLNMPRMNGFEVLEWVRQDAQCLRLIVHVLTASSREVDVARAYDLRANSYVVKPSRLNDLVAFAKALDQWHQFVTLPPEREYQCPVA
jgi:two-component system, response regulator